MSATMVPSILNAISCASTSSANPSGAPRSGGAPVRTGHREQLAPPSNSKKPTVRDPQLCSIHHAYAAGSRNANHQHVSRGGICRIRGSVSHALANKVREKQGSARATFEGGQNQPVGVRARQAKHGPIFLPASSTHLHSNSFLSPVQLGGVRSAWRRIISVSRRRTLASSVCWS